MNIGTSSSLGISIQMNKTTSAINRSLERLSTGRRVNRPSDDPGAFSASVTLDSQLRGLTQANININTSLGLLQTADSGMESQLDILTRIREIAVQGASSTLTSADRSNLNSELQALLEEYRRIASETDFNGMNLLDGSFGTLTVQLGANVGDDLGVDIESTLASDIFEKLTGAGTFKTAVTYSGGLAPYAVATGDIDSDGDIDLVVSEVGSGSATNTVAIYKNSGSGAFTARTTVLVGTDPRDVSLRDLNGDGVLDIVTADYDDDTVSVLKGTGDGTFQSRVTYAVGDGPLELTEADVNADGNLDIIVADYGAAGAGNTISILNGNGDGTFLSRTTLLVGTGPVGVVAEDLNGDGKVDFAVANVGGGANGVTTYMNQGLGSFVISATLTTGTTPGGIVSGDFDGDGDRDLAVSNAGSTTLTLFSNSGSGVFTNATTLTAGTAPQRMRVGDINNDGRDDIVAANLTTATLSLFTQNGAFSFTTGTAVASSNATGFYDVGMADFNGDGVLDFAIPNTGSISSTTSSSIGIHMANTVTSTAEGDVTVVSQAKASALIDIVDDAIAAINSRRGDLAAVHNRLESAAASNLLLQEAYSDALSALVDADIATETAELVKNQVLQQAQVAVAAQANLQTQVVLGLLRN